MFSALSIGCTSRKIPPDAINMPNIRKTHDQSDFDNVPNAPKNCRNPIPVKIIPKKKQKNLTMARGETRNRQPRKILKNPCRPVERLVSKGWEQKPLVNLSLAYIFSAAIGILMCVCVVFILGKFLSKK